MRMRKMLVFLLSSLVQEKNVVLNDVHVNESYIRDAHLVIFQIALRLM